MSNSNKISRTKKSQRKISTKRQLISVFIYLILFTPTAWADSLTIDAKVDKPLATTGDIITYTITLRHDMDLKPSMPDFSIINGFDLHEAFESKPLRIGNQIEQEYSIRLRADEIGIFTIPPIVISFEVIEDISKKSIPGQINSPEVIIEVASVLYLQGDPSEIRDIKDIVEVDKNWAPWFFWILNLILLMVVLYLFWKYRKIKGKPALGKAPIIPTHEIALRELDLLRNKRLLKGGNAREHFFQLSEIFRRYIGKRYSIPAPDWTTEEITEYFQQQSEVRPNLYTEAIRILNKSDLVKFAKVKTLTEADEIDPVRNFILSTRKHIELGLYSNQ